MIVECIKCKSKYDVPDHKITGKIKMKCSKCQTIFSIDEIREDSESDKDTAKIMKQNIDDSLWSDENLQLPEDKKCSLAIIKGSRAGYIYHIEKPYILIGRGKVDLIIPDKEVSRKHLAVEFRNKKTFLRDLGSTNGSFINDEKISITAIHEQTEFRIGQTTLMLISTPKNIDNFEK